MKNSTRITLALLCFSAVSFAQVDQSDYVVKGRSDTIFCSSVSVKRSSGNVVNISYYDNDDRKIVLQGKKDCQAIKSYRINGEIFDLIPLKASKPDGYKRHMWRKIDGKVTIYDYFNILQMRPMDNPSYVIVYTAKLGNNRFYKIKQKNIDKYLKSYLMRCEKFKETYKGKFTDERVEFEEMIKLYNAICDND